MFLPVDLEREAIMEPFDEQTLLPLLDPSFLGQAADANAFPCHDEKLVEAISEMGKDMVKPADLCGQFGMFAKA